MKKFIIYLVSYCCAVIGVIGYGVYYEIDDRSTGFKYLFLFLGICFLFIPATNSWIKFFKETFDKD